MNLTPNSVTVGRVANTKDAVGGPRASFTAVSTLTALPASVQMAAGSVVFQYAQRQIKVTGSVFLFGAYDIRRGDRLTDDVSGAVYQVEGVRDETGRGVLTVVDVARVL